MSRGSWGWCGVAGAVWVGVDAQDEALGEGFGHGDADELARLNGRDAWRELSLEAAAGEGEDGTARGGLRDQDLGQEALAGP